MPDFSNLIKALQQIFQMVSGTQIPSWVPRVTGIILLVTIILFAFWGLLALAAKIIDLWRNQLIPIFYIQEEKRYIGNVSKNHLQNQQLTKRRIYTIQ